MFSSTNRGPLPAGQPAGGIGFSSSPANSNLLAPSPTFGQSAGSPFSTTSMPSSPFAPQIPSSGGLNFASSSTPTFNSSPFGASTSSRLFGSTPFPFGVGSSPSIFGSLPLFSSSQATYAGFDSNTQSSFLFQSNAHSIGQTGCAFEQSTTFYGQNTSSAFVQGILGGSTTPGFGVNTFSSTSSLISSSNALGFGQSNPSFSMPFQPSQPAQTTTAFGLSSFGGTQPAGGSPFGGMPGILVQSNIRQLQATPPVVTAYTFLTDGHTYAQNIFMSAPQSSAPQSSAPQSSAVVQPVPATNPFGTLPAMPQMSIDRVGSAPSIQYGISTLPVVDKPAPVGISSLLTSRHLSQRRIRLPARKYHTKNDGPKVPFFSDDEEPSTPKADALFIPRENPRALVIRPTEQWPMRASAEKASALKDISTPAHENGKISQEAHGGSNSEDKDRIRMKNKGKEICSSSYTLCEIDGSVVRPKGTEIGNTSYSKGKISARINETESRSKGKAKGICLYCKGSGYGWNNCPQNLLRYAEATGSQKKKKRKNDPESEEELPQF